MTRQPLAVTLLADLVLQPSPLWRHRVAIGSITVGHIDHDDRFVVTDNGVRLGLTSAPDGILGALRQWQDIRFACRVALNAWR